MTERTHSNTNRAILDAPLYGKDGKDLMERTAAGETNPVHVVDMLRTVLFQYDPQPRDGTEGAFDERIAKLAFGSQLLFKLGEAEPVFEIEDINLLKALVQGMQFQAGSVRYQLWQQVGRLEVREIELPDETKVEPSAEVPTEA